MAENDRDPGLHEFNLGTHPLAATGFAWGKDDPAKDYRCDRRATPEQREWVRAQLRPRIGAVLAALEAVPGVRERGARLLLAFPDGSVTRALLARRVEGPRPADAMFLTPLTADDLEGLDRIEATLPGRLHPLAAALDEPREVGARGEAPGSDWVSGAPTAQRGLVVVDQTLTTHAADRLAFLGALAGGLAAQKDSATVLLLDPPPFGEDGFAARLGPIPAELRLVVVAPPGCAFDRDWTVWERERPTPTGEAGRAKPPAQAPAVLPTSRRPNGRPPEPAPRAPHPAPPPVPTPVPRPVPGPARSAAPPLHPGPQLPASVPQGPTASMVSGRWLLSLAVALGAGILTLGGLGMFGVVALYSGRGEGTEALADPAATAEPSGRAPPPQESSPTVAPTRARSPAPEARVRSSPTVASGAGYERGAGPETNSLRSDTTPERGGGSSSQRRPGPTEGGAIGAPSADPSPRSRPGAQMAATAPVAAAAPAEEPPAPADMSRARPATTAANASNDTSPHQTACAKGVFRDPIKATGQSSRAECTADLEFDAKGAPSIPNFADSTQRCPEGARSEINQHMRKAAPQKDCAGVETIVTITIVPPREK